MPIPKKPGEKQKDYMGRCVSHHVGKGYPQKQSVAICFNYWRGEHKKQKAKRPS